MTNMPHIAHATALIRTHDSLFDGALRCAQHKFGYRFSLDPILLAHFIHPQPHDQILDLGCGCGIIGLLLAYRHPRITLTNLEIQPELAQLARDNIASNHLGTRSRVLEGSVCNIKQLIEVESIDLVVSNPPYRKRDTGRINEAHQAALARHELSATLDDFIAAAAYSLKNRGKAAFIFPTIRANELLFLLNQRNLTPKRLQPIYSYPGEQTACLLMLEATKNGGEQLEFLPPFYIYSEKNGAYSEEMAALYRQAPC